MGAAARDIGAAKFPTVGMLPRAARALKRTTLASPGLRTFRPGPARSLPEARGPPPLLAATSAW